MEDAYAPARVYVVYKNLVELEILDDASHLATLMCDLVKKIFLLRKKVLNILPARLVVEKLPSATSHFR